MSKPVIAIIGRPNVGKSTLVNRIAQSTNAIVHESSGVTRDRSYHDAEWSGHEFTLVDTGGIDERSDDVFQSHITEQAMLAAAEASVIILLVDARSGITPEDERVARKLKRCNTPVIVAVNKLDDPSNESALWEFYALGLGDPMPISAIHGHGTGDLLDAALEQIDFNQQTDDDDGLISVALIGRPNAGKSSLTNRMSGKQRSIVSDVAGTTRDAIDTIVEHEGTTYKLVDTAGMRRKSLINDDIEFYGFVRSMRAIERADVALLIVDATIGLTDQDQRMATLADERGCALIILLNKWDLLETPEEREKIIEFLEDRFMFVSYAPVIRISALTGRSVHRIWGAIDAAYENRSKKIATSKLNDFLAEIREMGFTVTKGTRRLKMNYVTQTKVEPPEFTFFCNAADLVDDNYMRFLENRLRERFDLVGTPIRLRFKNKVKDRIEEVKRGK